MGLYQLWEDEILRRIYIGAYILEELNRKAN